MLSKTNADFEDYKIELEKPDVRQLMMNNLRGNFTDNILK